MTKNAFGYFCGSLQPACAIFGVDEFKEINDFFGTENGDKILQDIAKWFLKFDFETYRIDGDEFAILYYEDLSIEHIKHNIENILSLRRGTISYRR